MTELNAAESSVLVAVESSPGISARDLAKSLERRMADVLKTVQRLVDLGVLERRPLKRTRADGAEHSYNGLRAIPQVTDPSLCPNCQARRLHFPDGPECREVVVLRELGKTLNWRRVPYGPGQVVQQGEMFWSAFLDRASIVDMRAAIREARFWQRITATAPQEATT
jgi:hypothetical protein